MARKRSHTRRQPRSHPRGRIEMHRGGYGFVQTAEGEFFIPRSKTRGAFPDDVVEIAPISHYDRGRGSKGSKGGAGKGHKRTARVVSVVERAQSQIVGYFHRAEPFGVVEPVDPRIQHDIFTQLAEAPEIPDGAIVCVQIVTYPERNTAATGVVVEVLGDEDDERIPIDLVVARHKLETQVSQASLEQAASAAVDADRALADGYRDLRSRFIFTIDPADARDFDDAVSVEPAELPGGSAGWKVGVHIADVSEYVPWGSSIDLDARRRATSVYLVDRVIPMLPEELSNDICSLRPHEVRRTMTVDMLVDANGQVVSAEPYPALICSAARLTYDEALLLLQAASGDAPQDSAMGQASAQPTEQLQQKLQMLAQVAQARMQRREQRGGLDFDTVEARVRLNEERYPTGIDLRQKNEATQLIEEAMIMANEAVACYLRDAKYPCVYRVHEQPDADTLEGLVPVLAEFPWFKEVSEHAFAAGDPKAIQQVLALAHGRPEDDLVTTLVLRSMKRALYSPQLQGHYGLASGAYVHFTSPIRRYPDLIVHRMLKAALFGRPEKFDQEVAALPWLSEHSSEMERIAEKAARESQEIKIVELMEEHIGEKFSAMVSGVATFGLFVRLPNMAEGVVEISDLGNEYFILDAVRHTLTGSDTGKQFRLGRRIAVRLVEADRRTRTLRFRLV